MLFRSIIPRAEWEKSSTWLGLGKPEVSTYKPDHGLVLKAAPKNYDASKSLSDQGYEFALSDAALKTINRAVERSKAWDDAAAAVNMAVKKAVSEDGILRGVISNSEMEEIQKKVQVFDERYEEASKKQKAGDKDQKLPLTSLAKEEITEALSILKKNRDDRRLSFESETLEYILTEENKPKAPLGSKPATSKVAATQK